MYLFVRECLSLFYFIFKKMYVYILYETLINIIQKEGEKRKGEDIK